MINWSTTNGFEGPWFLHRCLDCQKLKSLPEFWFRNAPICLALDVFLLQIPAPRVGEKTKKNRLPPLASCTMAGYHVAAFTTASLCDTAVSPMTFPFDGIHRLDGHLSYLPHWHGMISSSQQSKYLKSLWIPTMKGYGTPAHQRSTPSTSVLARTRASRPSSNKRGALVLQNVGWDSHKEARNV